MLLIWEHGKDHDHGPSSMLWFHDLRRQGNTREENQIINLERHHLPDTKGREDWGAGSSSDSSPAPITRSTIPPRCYYSPRRSTTGHSPSHLPLGSFRPTCRPCLCILTPDVRLIMCLSRRMAVERQRGLFTEGAGLSVCPTVRSQLLLFSPTLAVTDILHTC